MLRRLVHFATVMALAFLLVVPYACDGGGGNVEPDPVCGDGVMEGTEECDTDDFGGQFCSDVNDLFVGGYLFCLPTCEIDVAHCELPFCGDDVAEGNEECDGLDMGPIADCTEHGFRCGYTTCEEESCTLNTDECVLEIPCESIDPTLQSEQAIGGYRQGGSEYSYVYESVVDMNNMRAWKIRIELWGDFVPGGLTTSPVTFTEADTDLNIFEAPHVIWLWECMNSDCCLGDGCMQPLKFYVPKAGTLQLTSLEQDPDGTLAGTLDGIEWKEIRIDWETGDASAVECGPCHALDASYTFDATVDTP